MAREIAGARPGASYRAKGSAELGLGLGPGLDLSVIYISINSSKQ